MTQRWFPTTNQLDTPEKLERAFRQVLEQHYSLVDRTAKPTSHEVGAPEGQGPSNTKFLGLNVVPIDTNTLANGAVLKYDKVNGNFFFG